MRSTDWLLLVFLSVLWGGSFFFAAVAVRDIPPLTLVLLRVSIAALILVGVGYASGLVANDRSLPWRDFAVLAVLNNIIPFSLIFYGQTKIASALASVLNATTPLFTLAVLRVFAGEALTAAKVAGGLMGVAGVAILLAPGTIGSDASAPLGMACVLGAALSYGFAGLRMRRLREVPPLVLAQAQLLCASLLLLPVAATFDRVWTLPMPSMTAWAAVLGLAAFSTALAYIVFFRINATAGPGNAMLVTLLIPVSATALGVLVLGEELLANHVAGAFVIAAGLVILDGRATGWLARRVRIS